MGAEIHQVISGGLRGASGRGPRTDGDERGAAGPISGADLEIAAGLSVDDLADVTVTGADIDGVRVPSYTVQWKEFRRRLNECDERRMEDKDPKTCEQIRKSYVFYNGLLGQTIRNSRTVYGNIENNSLEHFLLLHLSPVLHKPQLLHLYASIPFLLLSSLFLLLFLFSCQNDSFHLRFLKYNPQQ